MPNHRASSNVVMWLKWWPEALAGLVCLALGLWKVTSASLWRDESVTAFFASIPLSEAIRQWGQWDAVHALYYLIVRCLAWIDSVELVVRLPAVVAMACTAALTVRLGTLLVGRAVGLTAGLAFAVLPVTSQYAQQGRSYAMTTAFVVASMIAVLRLSKRPTPAAVGLYAFCVVLIGYSHLYALLIVPVHAVWILSSGVAGGRWRLIRAAALAWGIAALMLLPLVLIGASQREVQLYWLRTPDVGALFDTARFFTSTRPIAVALGALALVGAALSKPGRLLLVWVVVPVAMNWTISQVHPMYSHRYMLFVVPALVLGAACGIHALAALVPRCRAITQTVAAVALTTLIAASGAPQQQAMREPSFKSDDLRSLTIALDQKAAPGDAVVPISERYIAFVNAYGGPFERLPVMRDDSVDPGVDRVWVVTLGSVDVGALKFEQINRAFELAEQQEFGTTSLSLWLRR